MALAVISTADAKLFKKKKWFPKFFGKSTLVGGGGGILGAGPLPLPTPWTEHPKIVEIIKHVPVIQKVEVIKPIEIIKTINVPCKSSLSYKFTRNSINFFQTKLSRKSKLSSTCL